MMFTRYWEHIAFNVVRGTIPNQLCPLDLRWPLSASLRASAQQLWLFRSAPLLGFIRSSLWPQSILLGSDLIFKYIER